MEVVSFLVDQGTIGEWALEGLPSRSADRVGFGAFSRSAVQKIFSSGFQASWLGRRWYILILRHTAPRSGKVDTDTHRRSTTNQPTNQPLNARIMSGRLSGKSREGKYSHRFGFPLVRRVQLPGPRIASDGRIR